MINLAAELLREAEKLIGQKIHPQTIIAGWRRSTQVALEALARNALDNRLISILYFNFYFECLHHIHTCLFCTAVKIQTHSRKT